MSQTLIWIVFGIAYIARLFTTKYMTNKQPRGKIYYPWSYPLLLTTYSIVYFGSFFEYFFGVKQYGLLINYVGLFLLFAGIGVTGWSIKSVCSSWSQHIEIKKKHEYCKKGPYKYYRHPYYVGVFLELLGACFVYNGWYALWFLFLVHTPLVMYRAGLEDAVMKKAFPQAF